jgi:Icc-related predicted phosphoesterase
MNYKITNLIIILILFGMLFTLSGCNDKDYITIGVVSDIEGAIENAQESAEKLKDMKVEYIIIAGDCYENEQIRISPLYPESKDNIKEMINGIAPYAALKVPVYIIPGNHEKKEIYEAAIESLKGTYPNIHDISDSSIDLEGFNIVGLAGYHEERMTDPNGFLITNESIETAKENIQIFQEQDEPTLFVTHGPPLTGGELDYLQGFYNVGDYRITEIINSSSYMNIFHIHGHLHERGALWDEFNGGKSVNVAAITPYNNPNATEGRTGVLLIKKLNVTYYTLQSTS